MRRLMGIFVTIAGLVALAGCGSNAFAEARDDSGFATCMEKAGFSLGNSADWSASKQLSVMSQAGPLRCALDELDRQDRAGLLGSAFDESTASQRLAALRAFIDSQHGTTHQIAERVGMLLRAQDAAKPPPDNSEEAWKRAWAKERPQWLLAVETYEHVEGPIPGLQKWVRQHGGKRTDDVVLHYLEHQERFGSRVFRAVEPIRDTIDEVRDEE